MKKLFFLSIGVIALAACGQRFAADDFVGSWRAKNDKAPEGQPFYIADRLIIEKAGNDKYNASLLAQGVFTTMSYYEQKGYLCTEKGACFEMVNRNVIRIGSKDGIKEYEREIKIVRKKSYKTIYHNFDDDFNNTDPQDQGEIGALYHAIITKKVFKK